MRVIAGTAKGARLKAPKGIAVRPTSDRVKEALFSILGIRINDSLFLDLYAGSGAIGIESLSRGARACVFVDHKKENISLIKENLSKSRLTEKARLIPNDAEKTVFKLAREKFKADLVYLDPPYACKNIAPVVQSIFSYKVIDINGLLVVEHNTKNRQWTEEFPVTREKRYGDTCLTFIAPPDIT